MSIKTQPSKVSATQWGKTVTIEVDHSDTDLLELIDMFKGLAVGLEYSESSWRSVIKELGALYEEEDTEDLKHKLNEWKDDDFPNSVKNEFYDFLSTDEQINDYIDSLPEKNIDAALAEHNAHEEGFDIIKVFDIDAYVEGTTEDNYDEGGRPIEKDNYKSKE